MEKAEKIAMVLAGFGWSDVGSWDVQLEKAADENSNSSSAVGSDKLHFIGTRNTHVQSTTGTEKVIAAIGVDNRVIIDTPDALLVLDRSKSQDVGLLVEALKAGAMWPI